jgi:phosphoribosylamine--glycine ligase
MTRVLLVGSGAREHAIASALANSGELELYAAMSSHNPGITRLAKDASLLQITNPQTVSDYAVRSRVELAIVGPEAPLVNGVVDELLDCGIPTVGPTRALASLEGDKAFCRQLLTRHGIQGNPSYRIFTDSDSAETFLISTGPVAIKPAGLTGGKGVKVSGEDLPTKESEVTYAKEILRNRIDGVQKIIVEELLDGEEYSLQAFVDGKDIQIMPLVRDHKRSGENDSGPNTGGMGSYSDRDHLLPFVSQRDLDISSRIMKDVVSALREDTGEEYRGILYGQFMLAKSLGEDEASPKLIEFNCRFGDPEAMNVLPILSDRTDFLEVCEQIAGGSLARKHISFQEKATVCKYLVPATYPETTSAGLPVFVDERAMKKIRAFWFYASVDMIDQRIVTTTSRTIGVVGIGDSIPEAEQIAETATTFVKGPLKHRHDIGTSELIQRRIEHVNSLKIRSPWSRQLEVGIS